jgi:hypothetical protein
MPTSACILKTKWLYDYEEGLGVSQSAASRFWWFSGVELSGLLNIFLLWMSSEFSSRFQLRLID